ncbi:uncharacterized protein LOC121875385 [Homarus americanus]|uniref:uncharacterized protein LOC121875385 n=1 Tax=Homarus americanus TaxID=6706 RepID=UPI001C45B784|nr:uncharacterized protein LOC121875385 [Homarus americanus]
MRPHVILMTALACLLYMTEAVQEENGFSFNTNTGMSWLKELTSDGSHAHSRKKRAIGLPPGSNVEVKWSISFPFDTFTFYKAKLQFALPIKIPFPAALIVGGKEGRRSDTLDYNNIEFVEEQQGAPQWYQPEEVSQQEWHSRTKRAARQERASVYTYLEALFDKAGEDGRSCLLRTICDVAEAPFDQGLLGEMLNTLLTASLAGRPVSGEEKEYDSFVEAELHGKLNGKCQERYNKCKTSPFDLLPYAVHTVL